MTHHIPEKSFQSLRVKCLISMVGTILSFFLASTPVGATIIEGVIFSPAGPLPGSTISAYSDYQSLITDTNPIQSGLGDKTGQFRIDLPPGRYYLLARGEADGVKFFSYHGVNPITVLDTFRWLPFFMIPESPAICSPDGQGISGTISYKATPLSGGVVSVYPEHDGLFRGMGLLTNTLDEKGHFRFNLDPGSYVVVARRKKTARGIGPVMQGDLFCYTSANPIKVVSDQLCEIKMECYPRDNLLSFLDDDEANPQGRKHETRRQASLWDLQPETSQQPTSQALSTISGTVTDLEGRGLANIFVTAYPSMGLNLFQMHVLRLISPAMSRTDSAGAFNIDLAQGGRYYLVARDKVGAAPDRDELYGLYEGNQNHSVTVNAGEHRKNINLTVVPIMPASGLTQRLKE
ncbi:MAG: carboxypeptidase-like regulatory domain-containing protein [Proteobacteria bacterium]|nr:carboxypeptidase-like regulatory domain-containing protein [Pseudomonadota bacterium]MBU1688655.1 carboxypeptidase-like regulatory domain-containing protein [Pseudomonadota bacterium]